MGRQHCPHCIEGETEAKEIQRRHSVSYKRQRQESNPGQGVTAVRTPQGSQSVGL